MKPIFRLEPGFIPSGKVRQPIIELVSSRRNPYLWIGNDIQGDRACFAMLEGREALGNLANQILISLEK